MWWSGQRPGGSSPGGPTSPHDRFVRRQELETSSAGEGSVPVGERRVSAGPTGPRPPSQPPLHSHWILKSGGSRRMLETAMCPVSPSSNSTITASGSSSSSSLEEPAARGELLGWGGGPGPPTHPQPLTAAPHLAPRSPGTGTGISGSSRRRCGCPAGGCGATGAERRGPARKRCDGLWGHPLPHGTPPGPHPAHRLLQQLLLRVDALAVAPLALDDDAVAGEGAKRGGAQHPPAAPASPPAAGTPPRPPLTCRGAGWCGRCQRRADCPPWG